MATLERFIAFRGFGQFDWPPVPEAVVTGAAAGCVEIHHVLDPARKKYVACVRWLPATVIGAQVPPGHADWPPFTTTLDKLVQIESLTRAELAVAFAAAQNTELAYRCDADPVSGHAERAIFQGMSVFEQYALPSGPTTPYTPACTLRVPVLHTYTHGHNPGKNPRHSGIQIGLHHDAGIRVNLALAAAAPQNLTQHKNDAARVAFSALFSPVLEPKHLDGQAPRFNTLTFGPPWSDSPRVRTEPGRIGEFGFAKFGEINQDYAVCEDDGQWPTEATILEGTLTQLGFRFKPERQGDMEQADAARLEEDSELLRMPGARLSATAGTDNRLGYRLRQSFAISSASSWAQRIDAAQSDIRLVRDGPSRTKHFQLRAPTGGDHWIDMADTIYIVIDIDGAMGADEVWNTAHAVTFSARIGWAEQADLVATPFDPFKPAPAMELGAKAGELLSGAIAAMRLARLDLHHLSPEQPQSLLPELQPFIAANAPERHYGLFTCLGKLQLDHRTGLDRSRLGDHAGLRASYMLSLQTDDIVERGVEAARLTRLAMQASWPSFFLPTDSKQACDLVLCHAPQALRPRADRLPATPKEVRFVAFWIKDETNSRRAALTASLGGLAFRHLRRSVEPTGKAGADAYALLESEDPDRSMLRFAPRAALLTGPKRDRQVAAGNMELTLRFMLDAAAPVAVDVKQGDRSGSIQPLLLRETAPTVAEEKSRYLLDITETLDDDAGWRLVAAVSESQKSVVATVKTIKFSHEPFSVQRLLSSSLDSLGNPESNTVAKYDSDTRVWELQRDERPYHYVLPPQAAGESMDKPRRLEIHDAGNGDGDTALEDLPDFRQHGYLSPVVPGGGSLQRRAVEFRLTPPAELWIAPSDVQRNFFAPQWASAQIFRQKGELGLGAALVALRAEFLYGLAVAVSPKSERSLSRRARVAELEALTGSPLGDGSSPDSALQERWQNLRTAMARRPERLELWADDPDSEVPFAPARFSDGARFSLRTTALHRPAVADAESTDPWPTQRQPLSPRLHASGLSGGALWPVESNNVLNMILDEPLANKGAIERIALSAHGGDSDQNAKFCGGRISLISSTRAGFVQRQKVEIIGRIGVFWHRAKHVVVYERTVNPSAQFTPEGGLGTRTRRPVLRKISEYIELLEPERRYPDMQGARVQTSSFLRSVRFNSRIIAVDSAWAEDVPGGWQVPLWNRHAARQRPQVYPRPDTAFVTAAEGRDASAETAQECLDPDNLFFYADTSPGQTDQTDTWQARLNLDYTNLPPPSDADGGSSAAGAPAVPPRVPSGFTRFTWSLAPSSQRTAINAGRADKHVYAALETLTFMRAAPSEPSAVAKDKAELLKAARAMEVAAPPLLEGIWLKGAPLPGSGDRPMQIFAHDLAATLKELEPTLPGDQDKIDKLRNQLERMIASTGLLSADTAPGQPLATQAKAMSDKFVQAVNSLPKLELDSLDASGFIDGVPKYCIALKANLTASISAKRLAMTQELRAWQADVSAGLDTKAGNYQQHFATEQDLRDFVAVELRKFLLPVFADTTPEFGKLRRGIETARATLADARAQIDAQLRAALVQLQTLDNATDMSKPWSEARLKQFETRLDEVFQRAAAKVGGVVQDGKRRLATELDDFSQKVGMAAARALDLLAAASDQLDTILPQRRQLAALLLELDTQIARHQKKSAQLFQAVRDALAKAEAKKPELKDKLARIQAASDQLETTLDGATGHARIMAAQLADAGGNLSDAAHAALADLQELAGTAGSTLQQVLAALNTDLAGLEADLLKEIGSALDALRLPVDALLAPVLQALAQGLNWIQALLAQGVAQLEQATRLAGARLTAATGAVQEVADAALVKVKEVEQAIAPDKLVDLVLAQMLGNAAVQATITRAVASTAPLQADLVKWRALAKAEVARVAADLEEALNKAVELSAELTTQLKDACMALSSGIASVRQELLKTADELLAPMKAKLDAYRAQLEEQLKTALGNAEEYVKLVEAFGTFEQDIRTIGNDLASSAQNAQAYSERVVSAIGSITSGGLDAAPGNILRAFAAAGDAPVMPNLQYAKDRLAYYYGAVNDVVDMTPVEAWFGRLSEGLAAMGLTVPCNRIGNYMETMKLSDSAAGSILNKFAGCNFEWLLKGRKMPAGLSDAIRITHDYDKARQRAWVQIDVNVPFDGRSSLFSVGPFSLDLVNATLTGQVRLEASADSAKVEQTGSALIQADFDAVVGGQSMVQLSEVKVRYDKSGGLKVDFDPKNIKLNPTFQNIQNVLTAIVGDELGGLKVIWRGGIPVGLEHVFCMPPISLMAGTSGIQYLQICNQFQLIAYPDFMLANRFSLARPDKPFIFSVFIIGGTGWLTVDVEYRPFKDELMVIVDAGAGGSASLGFAFAGCTGSVAITMSMALTYRKMIGKAGGGLTVSLVVLIIGVVDVLSIANACLSVMLRVSYRDSCDADATGTFRLKIRISRFFEVSAGGQARYEMKGGRRQSSSSTDAGYKVTDPNLAKAQQLINGQKG